MISLTGISIYAGQDPNPGRLLDRSSLDEPNLYTFVKNDPINGWDYLGLETKCCNGKAYDPKKECCCGTINKVEKKADPKTIEDEYTRIILLTKKYSAPENNILYGGKSNKSYWAIGFWGEPYQCSEQAAQYVDVMLYLKLVWWNIDVIGGKGKILKHHVARVSCICRTGDCPHTEEEFTVDPYNSDFSCKKSEKEFWKNWTKPITGAPLK